MAEARIVRSLHDIDKAAWDACFPGALEGYDYLAAVEDADLPGFSWFYVLAYEDGRLLAAAPAFITDYALDTTLIAPVRRAIGALRRLAPRAFLLKFGALGSPCTETLSLGFADAAPREQRVALLEVILSAFEAEALAAGCSLLAAKDAPLAVQALWEQAADARAYHAVRALPVAWLDIDFPNLEAYLADLSRATRKDMRRKLKALDHIRVEVRIDLNGVEDRVLALYRDTYERADQQLEELTGAYFTGVLAAMPGQAFCVLYYDGPQLLATNLLIQNHGTLLDKFFCMEAGRGRQHNLYFLSWFTNLRLCLERGLVRYQSGQAGYANKLRLGSQLAPAQHYFRHRNRLLNLILSWAAPLLSEDPAPGQGPA